MCGGAPRCPQNIRARPRTVSRQSTVIAAGSTNGLTTDIPGSPTLPTVTPRLIADAPPAHLAGGFLALLVLLQFGYPVTLYGQAWGAGYQFAYASLFVVGAWATRRAVFDSTLTVASAVGFAAAGVWYLVSAPEAQLPQLVTYATLIPFEVSLIYSLWGYVAERGHSGLTNLFSAVSVYLLLGALFVPVYGLLEEIAPGSFIDAAAPDAPIVWQQFQYYSFVTLNTVGFGDVRPVTPWARSLSNLEALLGVLFVAVTITHLVGAFRLRSDA